MKHLPDLLTLRHRCPLFRSSVRSSVRPSVNSSVMSKFDIYVKVSILINYKTKQQSNLAYLSDLLTLRHRHPLFRSSVRLSVYQHLCRSSTFMSKLVYLSITRLTTIKPCMKHLPDLLTLRHRRPLFRLSVRPSVCQHLCRSSTFMSKLVF